MHHSSQRIFFFCHLKTQFHKWINCSMREIKLSYQQIRYLGMRESFSIRSVLRVLRISLHSLHLSNLHSLQTSSEVPSPPWAFPYHFSPEIYSTMSLHSELYEDHILCHSFKDIYWALPCARHCHRCWRYSNMYCNRYWRFNAIIYDLKSFQSIKTNSN